jgi:hypothetical protein
VGDSRDGRAGGRDGAARPPGGGRWCAAAAGRHWERQFARAGSLPAPTRPLVLEGRAIAVAPALISRRHEQGALPLAARDAAAGAVLGFLAALAAAGAFTLSPSVCPRSSCLHGPVGALDGCGLARRRQTSLAHPPPRAAGVADCQFAHGSIDLRPLLHVALASCVTLARPELGAPARPAAHHHLHHRRRRHAVMYALISSDLLHAADPRPLPGR